jgi:hypothetical protein
VSSDAADRVSLSQAVADLKAMDKRLAALIAAYPTADAGGPDLGAPIRESRALVRAAIGLLAGAVLSGQPPDHVPGTAKRRVKIKAASASTASSGPAHVETAIRSDTDASIEPAKPASRGGDRVRVASAAASQSAATSTEAPPHSLLARLGAATPEPGARHLDAPDVAGDPTPTPAPQPSHVSAHAASERLARLEAEIDNLTEATKTGGHRSKSATADAPAASAAKIAETKARADAAVAATASATAHRPFDDDEGSGNDDEDAEIVIVTPATKSSAPAREGTPPARQSPRIYQDPPPSDDDDAEVEIVQPGARPGARPGADGRTLRAPATADGGRGKAGTDGVAAPAKWRLFRGSR